MWHDGGEVIFPVKRGEPHWVQRFEILQKKTGVSITTISQILNGKGSRFSEATRNKVFQTAKDLAYKPNFFAKNMVTNRTNTIGMIVPEVTDPFFFANGEGRRGLFERA